jgi:hypothetical protein
MDRLAEIDPGRGLRHLLRPPSMLSLLPSPSAHITIRGVPECRTAQILARLDASTQRVNSS